VNCDERAISRVIGNSLECPGIPYYTKRHILFYVEKSELTELFRARDASCPKGKKMEHRKSLTKSEYVRRLSDGWKHYWIYNMGIVWMFYDRVRY